MGTWIGVAGWDYPDWVGPVYPASAGRGFDKLAWIARYVDVVEVNSTFYRPNEPEAAAAWVRRTAKRPGFRFTAKVHRSLTHEPVPDGLEDALRRSLRGLEPLKEAGVLGTLLLQFPQRFHFNEPSCAHLDRLLERLAGWPVVVEVRHVSWDSDLAAAWLSHRGAGWCVVDQPKVAGAIAEARPRVTSSLAYLRLHGRNAANWFRENAQAWERYDYLYTPDELLPLAEAARRMAESAEHTFVVQNNHFRGQGLANALRMKHLVQGTKPPAPEEVVTAFPDLADVVEVEKRGLF